MTIAIAELDEAWQRTLAQAWQSYLAGTTPVGAVVTNPAGEVVAEGRGRRYENPDGGRQLTYSHIAHACVGEAMAAARGLLAAG